jgi:hypothetical protein
MAVLRLVSTSRLASSAGGGASSSSSTSSIPDAKQASDGQLAVSDYYAENKTWYGTRTSYYHKDRETALIGAGIDFLTAWVKYPGYQGTDKFKESLQARGGPAMAAHIKLELVTYKRGVSYLSDDEIRVLCEAVDDWEPYGRQSGRFDPIAHAGFQPMGGAKNRPYSTKWDTLYQGAAASAGSNGRPDPADPNQERAVIVAQYGLQGLKYYCQAVPAVRLLARLEKGSPTWPQTAKWREQLEPLVYSGVTQGDLDTAAGGIKFSNPFSQTGRLAEVAAKIFSVKATGGPDASTTGTTAGTGLDSSGLAGIPWTTIIILAVIGFAVWYFLVGRKGA